MSFVGKLSFVSQVLPSSRPFMRRLFDAIKGKRKQQRCRLPIEFKLDCAIWLQRIQQWNGLLVGLFILNNHLSSYLMHLFLVLVSIYNHFHLLFHIDQIPTALQPGHAVSGTWHSSMSHLLSNRSIAYLELFSVVYALTMLAPVLHNQSVLILTDNASNVPIINKLRTQSSAIIGLLRSLAELSATHVFACSARHISGESNVLADFLSRPALHLNSHVQTWSTFESSHSLPSLSHVTTVCSSSLHLPNPIPISTALNLNVHLNYMPSLIFSNPCHFVSSTKRSYASHQQTFFRFCHTISHDPLKPMTPDQLCACMCDYVSTHKITTLPSYLSALADFYRSNSLGELPREHERVVRVRKGLNNYYSLSETTTPKSPLGFAELTQLHKLIDFSTFAGAREWAAYTMSFFALLRRSEILDTRLTFAHIQIHTHGMSITVPFSKTNNRPHIVHICKRDDFLCPIHAFLSYQAFIPSKLRIISNMSCFSFHTTYNTSS